MPSPLNQDITPKSEYTPPQAAAILGVSPTTILQAIYRWQKGRKGMPARRIGIRNYLIKHSDLMDYAMGRHPYYPPTKDGLERKRAAASKNAERSKKHAEKKREQKRREQEKIEQEKKEELNEHVTLIDAANFLNITMSYIHLLIRRGKIKSANGLIERDDLLSYKQERDSLRMKALSDITRSSNELKKENQSDV